MGPKFRGDFTFGGAVAESDPLLGEAFWDNGDFTLIETSDDPRRFVIGRTGSGKSADFRRLEEKHANKVIRIAPENLSLPYITNLSVVRQLYDLQVRLDPFFKALWKHVILVEILRHRYTLDSPQKKHNVMTQLVDRLKRDPAKKQALEYLNEFGDKFWCEASERVKQIAETLETKVAASGGLKAGVPALAASASSSVEQTQTQEVRRELADRFQKIINDIQLARLNQMIAILSDEILDADQHFTYLLIDDLDRDWAEDSVAKVLIRCLFQAVIDMQRVKRLKILVALRTNIFHELTYGELARGGQEEKFRALALNIRWTRADLKQLLDLRAQAACRRHNMHPARTIEEMLPKGGPRGQESPLDYIIDRTLMRPRDAIVYLNLAVRQSVGKDHITWESIRSVERTYSQDRLQALRDEWISPYPGLDRVLEVFRGLPGRLTREQFSSTLNDIALLVAEGPFKGRAWLSPMCEMVWGPGSEVRNWFELYGQLVQFLYRIGFIGLGQEGQRKATFVYEEELLADVPDNIGQTAFFEVHPAFRPALDIVEEPTRRQLNRMKAAAGVTPNGG
jgi:hypothetical protein